MTPPRTPPRTGEAESAAARARGLADAEAAKVKGFAEAQAIEAHSRALSENQEAVVAQQLAENWPEIVRAGASALGYVDHMVVLNGADGVSDMLAKALTLGGTGLGLAKTLLASMREDGTVPVSTNGSSEPVPAATSAPSRGRSRTGIRRPIRYGEDGSMSKPSDPYRVCFICTGNICRSPMAEAVFRDQVRRAGMSDRIEVDSAGTGDWYTGDPPQPGTLDVLRQHGIDGSDLHARGFEQDDFGRFDLIVCLDTGHRDALRRYAGPYADRIHLLREYDRDADSPNVPDPYLGPLSGFELAYTLIEPACRGLLDAVTAELRAVER